MGLAASQARFLCLTARKADCEYKSTELAQQKLEITNQLSDISGNYAQAMQSTKLMWSNEAVAADYGVSYNLLMSPSATNDYNPYMITTPSGAVVLNSEYAAAARAAGISKAGGMGSQASRDKFINALIPSGYVTQGTADTIVKNTATDNNFIDWNPIAGLGSEPLDKGSADYLTLGDIILSENMGKKTIDWAKCFVDSDDQMTEKEQIEEQSRLIKLQSSISVGNITPDIIDQLKRDLNNEKNKPDKDDTEVQRLQDLLLNAKQVMNQYVAADGRVLDSDGNPTSIQASGVIDDIKSQLSTDMTTLTNVNAVKWEDRFNTDGNSLDSGTYSIIKNNVINHYKDEIAEMNIGDLLANDIVVMSNGVSETDFKDQMKRLFDSITKVFGYSKSTDMSGQGLNIDESSASALKYAYDMTVNQFFKRKVQGVGSRVNPKSMTDNSAYLNAQKYNAIGNVDGYYALSLKNLVSSFLTYYDNFLAGVDSQYIVGASVDTSEYVTDDRGYLYVGKTNEDAVTSMAMRNADFFDQLYNNILEHGWREDVAIEDSEYLESAIKDGRYSMMSLNQDGYYYQTRYNETGYMVEVLDTDAIARAEAEFTAKKAELTYKEDSIDIKTKQLDAEISAITTEYESVKNLITKSIEKTFQMFAN